MRSWHILRQLAQIKQMTCSIAFSVFLTTLTMIVRTSEWSLIVSLERSSIQSLPSTLGFLMLTDLSPRTGDLLLTPVCPNNAPNGQIFVNMDSKNWFEAQSEWPSGNIGLHLPAFSDVAQVEEAVVQWVCVLATWFVVFVLSAISSRCQPATFSL